MEVFIYGKTTDRVIDHIQGVTSVYTNKNLICFHDEKGYKTMYDSNRVKCTIYFD